MKNTIIWIVVIILAVGGYFLFRSLTDDGPVVTNTNQNTNATTTQNQNPASAVIGKSIEGRDIVAYNFGTGTTKLLFIGGIHGGYEWNTSAVAYELINYLNTNPSAIPSQSNIKVTVIPVLNPDGLYKTFGTTTGNFAANAPALGETIPGRFNANDVDLNRNFDCDWQATGKWQDKNVSGGDSVFSEPESLAIKNYVESNKPNIVIVWYSSAGGVYASSCHNGVSTETNTITQKYASASGYPAFQSFDFYATTGDMVNWLAKNNIPAISVLLTNHTDTEWAKNLRGFESLIELYAAQ